MGYVIIILIGWFIFSLAGFWGVLAAWVLFCIVAGLLETY